MQIISMNNRLPIEKNEIFYLELLSSPYQNKEIMKIVYQLIQDISNENPEMINRVYDGTLSEKIVEEKLDYKLLEISVPEYMSLHDIKKVFLETVFGYGILQFLIDDPKVTDIFVNSHDCILKRVAGEDHPLKIKFNSEKQLEEYFRSILARLKAQINRNQPIVDTRDVKNKLRINGGIDPIVKQPYFTIRKHQKEDLTMKDLINLGTVSQEVALYLERIVNSKLNVLISGPTGSGKTTLLKGLTEYIKPLERLVVIEEEEELQIWHRNIISMEAQKKGGESETEITMDDLVRNAMRMSPRRIILGELRGKEALNLIRAFGTGHDGGLTTIHANNVSSALSQLSFLMLYAKTPLKYSHLMNMIANTVDIVIHISQYKVTEIAEVIGYDSSDETIKLNSIWKWKIDSTKKGKYVNSQSSDALIEKMTFRQSFYQKDII